MASASVFLCLMIMFLMPLVMEAGWRVRVRARIRARIRARVRIWGKRTTPCAEKECGRSCIPGKSGDTRCFFTCLAKCPDNNDAKIVDGHLIPLPLDFNTYDVHGKGAFDTEDLAAIFGDDPSDEGLAEAFAEADTNEDGRITPDELKNAPWIFEGEEHIKADNEGDGGNGVIEPPEVLKKPTQKDTRALFDNPELSEEEMKQLESHLSEVIDH